MTKFLIFLALHLASVLVAVLLKLEQLEGFTIACVLSLALLALTIYFGIKYVREKDMSRADSGVV